MKAHTITLLSALLLLPLAATGTDMAYTWTDASGTRHFSEDPPNDHNIEPVQIELLPAPSAGNIGGEEDFYSVINQADRMQRKRLESEKLGAEKSAGKNRPESTLPDNAATRENVRYNPAYPQDAGNRIPAGASSRLLQAQPGAFDGQPVYAPAYPRGN